MKKIKNTIMLFLAFFTIAFYISSCKDPEPVYNQVRQELKDWGAFKQGTWWVYEEENLKIRDSIFIYNYEDQFSRTEVENHFEQSVRCFLASTRQVDSGYFFYAHSNPGIQLRNDKFYNGENSKKCYLVVPPPVQGETISTGSTSQFTVFDTIYPMLQVGDHEFTNVVRANNNMNLFYNGTPTLIYSAKHIGIVRKEFPEYNQVWNLIKYNIVQ
jgi:hypothetical protein